MGEIEGRILKIFFYDKKNGYTIAKFKVYREQWFMNVLGYNLPPPIGEILELTGECIGHDKYGLQFHVEDYEVLRPATLEDIGDYLESGAVKGLGPQKVKKMLSTFGKDILDIVRNDPDRLGEIPGFGPDLIGKIREALVR